MIAPREVGRKRRPALGLVLELEVHPGLVEIRACLGDLGLRRPELRPSGAYVMFWWCGPEDRRLILQRFAVSREIMQEVVDDLRTGLFFVKAKVESYRSQNGRLPATLAEAGVISFAMEAIPRITRAQVLTEGTAYTMAWAKKVRSLPRRSQPVTGSGAAQSAAPLLLLTAGVRLS